MRTLVTLFVALLSVTADAQPEEAWYESDERISAVHRTRRTLRFGVTTNYLRLINPLDVLALADIATRTPPASISYTPGPELSPFLTSETRSITQEGFAELCAKSPPLLLNTDGYKVESSIDQLRTFKINCEFVSQQDSERINGALTGMVGIGRFEAVRSLIPYKLVAVRNLSRSSKFQPYISISDRTVLIEIRPYDLPLISSGFEQSDNESSLDSAAAALPRVCSRALGDLYWGSIPDHIRNDFIQRFSKVNPAIAKSRNHPARGLFTEAFAIAVLYPTTFDTHPVGTFSIPGPHVPGPPTGELLERIRFVDAILDPIEKEFLNSIPESAFEPPADDK